MDERPFVPVVPKQPDPDVWLGIGAPFVIGPILSALVVLAMCTHETTRQTTPRSAACASPGSAASSPVRTAP